MEHFNSILFQRSGPTNEQHTYQIIKKIVTQLWCFNKFKLFFYGLHEYYCHLL
jgi:hypothetical protein